MAIDANTNLLHDLFPDAVATHDLTRDIELLEILKRHFNHGESRYGSQEIIFSNSGVPAMRVLFDAENNLVACRALDGLTEELLAVIRERFREKPLESIRVVIGREVCFSNQPVNGWWRYRDCFQILPVPPHAPRPVGCMDEHPFHLEYCFDQPRDPHLFDGRRLRAIWPIHLVLNALISTQIIRWPYGQTDSTSQRSWVLLPFTTDPPEWNIAYLPHSYTYEGYQRASERFSSIDGIPPINSVPAEEYYDGRRGFGDLSIPDNLCQSLDLFFQASSQRRQQILRACYWLSQIDLVPSFSLRFICAVQAIDALLPAAPSGIRCNECGKDRAKSRTELFGEFLDRFASSPTVTDKDRRALFRIRSGLTHGFRDPLIMDQASNSHLHPVGHADARHGSGALSTARVAFYNWLHTPEPTA